MWVRIVTAAAALVSAAIHLYLWFDGYRDIDKIGLAFMVNAIAGAVIAALLLTWHHWLPAFLVLGFGASTLGAFVISSTVGLFGVNEQWTGGWVLSAAVAEVLCILGGLALLRPVLTSRRPLALTR
ncbi:hypothetical protein V6K52_01730 [Knoellia sp. S7-12]|uniref:hypothetical protein n=1 Tax=Knoellia sp. S7-12 TaxID=3126698 RepID=UPI003369659D